MKNFKYELGTNITIIASGEAGIVTGRAEYDTGVDSYYVHYKAADGRAVNDWWNEDRIEATDMAVRGTPPLHTLRDKVKISKEDYDKKVFKTLNEINDIKGVKSVTFEVRLQGVNIEMYDGVNIEMYDGVNIEMYDGVDQQVVLAEIKTILKDAKLTSSLDDPFSALLLALAPADCNCNRCIALRDTK